MSGAGTTEVSESGRKGERTVLIAMDGSRHAIYAFEWYAQTLHEETDRVIIAHCAEPGGKISPLTLLGGNPVVVETMIKEHEQHVQEIFDNIEEVAKKLKIKHKRERLLGPPGECIVKEAERKNVSLIIVGSRGHGTVRRTIMGSVSDYIVHHAHVPVIVVKHESDRKRHRSRASESSVSSQ